MEVTAVESWIANPDVCRCCLAATGTLKLTTPSKTEKDTFADKLYRCFGITLTYPSVSASHAVCDQCLSSLQTACQFKERVLAAEVTYVKYWKDLTEKDVQIKLETEYDYCEYDLELPTEICGKSGPDTEQAFHQEAKPILNEHYDTCVAELTDNKYESKESTLDPLRSKRMIKDQTSEEPKIPNVHKTVSERKRVIVTCGVLLNETTACPFRHHKSWFQCFYCIEEFRDMTNLRQHIKSTHKDIPSELRKMKRYPRSLQIDISNFECRSCQLSLTDVDAMQRHLLAVHDKVIYKECIADYKVDCSPYTCHLCNEEFHVFRTLTTHLNEHYANCICDVCGRSFLNSKRLKVHKRTHENGHYPCVQCGKVLKTKTSRANHIESAHSKRQIKCQICLKPMKHYNERIKHMSEVHKITHIFKCKLCFKEYNVKHYLATHMRQTHGSKNKKCPQCDMVFVTNHSLKKHMSKHTGVKPHKCVECGKAYARSYTLKEHMKCHEIDKNCHRVV